MKISTVVLAGVVFLAAGVLAGWHLDRVVGPSSRGGPDEATAPVAPADAVVATPASPPVAARKPAQAAGQAGSTPVAETPLALDDRPLLEQLPALDARLRQGDARAACDAGVAIAQCLQHQGRPPPLMTPEQIAQQPAQSQAQLTEMTARVGARFERMQAACAGIERATHLAYAQNALLSAAQRGSARARAEFLRFPLGAADLLRHPELGRLYAANAPRLFEAMWEEGDVAAIEVISEATRPSLGDGQRPAAFAVPESLQDPQLARALRERLMRATLTPSQLAAQPPRPSASHLPPLDPQVVARAEQLWAERFEASPALAALREARHPPVAPALPSWEKMPLFRPCEPR